MLPQCRTLCRSHCLTVPLLLLLLSLSHAHPLSFLPPSLHQAASLCPTIPQPNPPPTSPLYHSSCDYPLLRTLSTAPRVATLTPLLDHVAFIDVAVTTAARQSRDTNTIPQLTTCNSRSGEDWAKGAESYFAERNWGVLNRGCVSTVYGAGEDDRVVITLDNETTSAPQGKSSRFVYDAVFRHAKMMNDASDEVAHRIGGDWAKSADNDSVNRGWNYQYSTRAQSCTNDYVGFVKRNGLWYVAERITNLDKSFTAGENGRLYIHEYVRLSEGGKRLQGARMGLRERADEAVWRDSTTALRVETGSVTASEFVAIFQPNNLAVIEALKSGSHQTQQANDATTPSNIAILALPLAMNLVPVALIADVNSLGMLVYTLLTDVLTTIPLAIKGVEVISIGASSNTAVVTRITGGNLWSDSDKTANKAAETWVAECRANGNFTAIGVVLLVVAITFMIGGVVAEILAKRFVKKAGKVLGEDSSSSGALTQPNSSAAAAVLAMGAGWRAVDSNGRKSE